MSILNMSQLRNFKGFENVSDQEGQEIINTLYQFSLLAFRFFHLRQLLKP